MFRLKGGSSVHCVCEHLFTAMPMPPLDGVAEQWEDSGDVREALRTNKSIFRPAPFQEAPLANVTCAEVNYQALKPLAQRLKDSDGRVGQLRVPDIHKQTLAPKPSSFLYSFCFHVYLYSIP